MKILEAILLKTGMVVFQLVSTEMQGIWKRDFILVLLNWVIHKWMQISGLQMVCFFSLPFTFLFLPMPIKLFYCFGWIYFVWSFFLSLVSSFYLFFFFSSVDCLAGIISGWCIFFKLFFFSLMKFKMFCHVGEPRWNLIMKKCCKFYCFGKPFCFKICSILFYSNLLLDMRCWHVWFIWQHYVFYTIQQFFLGPCPMWLFKLFQLTFNFIMCWGPRSVTFFYFFYFWVQYLY